MTTLRQAAIAVIARWDLPHRHHQLSTTRIFEDLRQALEDPEQESVATVQCVRGVTFGYLDVMQPVGTKLYAAQVEAPDIKALQAEGKGPAPCARFCESNAFKIEIRNAAGERQVLQAKCDAFLANVQLLKVEIEAMTKERDALLAAGKLALDALDDWYYGVNQDRPKAQWLGDIPGYTQSQMQAHREAALEGANDKLARIRTAREERAKRLGMTAYMPQKSGALNDQ